MHRVELGLRRRAAVAPLALATAFPPACGRAHPGRSSGARCAGQLHEVERARGIEGNAERAGELGAIGRAAVAAGPASGNELEATGLTRVGAAGERHDRQHGKERFTHEGPR